MKKNILIFDVESNGLYGEPFAFGALIADHHGEILHGLAVKIAHYNLQNPDVDPWVKQHVLPALEGIKEVGTHKELYDAFYEFYTKYKDECTVWSDVNYPVETNFLREVALCDIEERRFNMPYPLYDVANFVDVNVDRNQACIEFNAFGAKELIKHNPFHDAKASYLCLINSSALMYGWNNDNLKPNNIYEQYYPVHGAGQLSIGTSARSHTDRVFGFSFGVSWAARGCGGVMDREDAKKLAEFILDEYNKVTPDQKQKEQQSLKERDERQGK